MILATVVRSSNTRDGIDYFPLMVDFEEKLYAAGKIKGSRFIKREGRPSDEAILSGRMVDRAIRPLFDERIRNDVQVIVTSLSVDGENDAATTALIAASCALTLSPIPWDGPIAAARIGRIGGQFILNATMTQIDTESDLDLVVAGTPDRLIMAEAGAKEVAEADMLAAMKWGCHELQPVLDLMKQIEREAGVAKTGLPEVANDNPALADDVEEAVRQATRTFIRAHADEFIFDSKKMGRKERQEMIARLEAAVSAHLIQKGFEPDTHSVALKQIKSYVSEEVSRRILDKEERLDGRALTEVRPLHIETDLLPRTHGSALFMRGDTQVLSTVTLGAPGDVQTLDTMEEEGKKRYMHHYNDAPYTYAETGPLRGPGRRAIGHGALAERALEPILPKEEEFPYAIRVVSEVLGSNGSSSMASTCGSSLSLMAAGVPIRRPIAGIAMGLASEMDKTGSITRWEVLTDLQDVEDGPGGMDFKIAGTEAGITAIQMDTKTHGLNWEIVERTVAEARAARLRILEAMATVIAVPRPELSPYAPRIETIRIDPEKIRDVIGPGGKIINKIIADTGVQIDIEQDGRVMVTSVDADGMRRAIDMITQLTKEVAAGEIYEGKVVRLEDFGVFVQILPNKDGMVHVSEIAWTRVGKPGDVLNLGDVVKVKVKEIDQLGRINLTMKELLPKPEGYVPYEAKRNSGLPHDRRGFGGGPPRRGGFGRRDQ